MTTPQLAPTTFFSGADDSLAVVDVYKASGEVVNDYTSGAGDAAAQEAAAKAIPVDIEISSLDTKEDKYKDTPAAKKKLDPNSFSARMLAVNAAATNAIRGMSATLQGAMAKANDLSAKVKVEIGGVITTVTSTDITSLKGLTGVMVNLTDSPAGVALRDIATTVAVAKNLIHEANKCGLTGFLTEFSKNADFRQFALTSLALSAAQSALGNSNHKLLGEITRIGGAAYLKKKYPGYASKFSKRFRTKATRGPRGNKLPIRVGDQYGEILTIYREMDPNFGRTTRAGRTCLMPQAGPSVSKDYRRSRAAYACAQAPQVGRLISEAKLNGSLVNLRTSQHTPDEAFLMLTDRVKSTSVMGQIELSSSLLRLPSQVQSR